MFLWIIRFHFNFQIKCSLNYIVKLVNRWIKLFIDYIQIQNNMSQITYNNDHITDDDLLIH